MQNQGIRRRDVLALLGASAGMAAFPARAQTYPDRPVRLVVPFAAGTTTDLVSRVLANELAEQLGQPIVVDNRPGAGGTVASAQVARSPADGYQVVMGTVGTHAINATLFKEPGYDALNDFAPLALIGMTPTLLVVQADGPLKSIQNIADKAAQSQGVTFASAGNGTSGHLAGELLKSRLGGNMIHVPYKAGGEALNDVMTGRVDFMFYHPAAVMPHIRSGKLAALGASSAKRSAAAPDVPTVAELTNSDFDLVAWFMLYAPAKTPEPILARLRDATAKAMAKPSLADKLAAQGLEPAPLAVSELRAFGEREIAKWGELVRRAGAQVQ